MFKTWSVGTKECLLMKPVLRSPGYDIMHNIFVKML